MDFIPVNEEEARILKKKCLKMYYLEVQITL